MRLIYLIQGQEISEQVLSPTNLISQWDSKVNHLSTALLYILLPYTDDVVHMEYPYTDDVVHMEYP